MLHANLLERKGSGLPSQDMSLLVLWQHPLTREISAIGALTMRASGGYEFHYTAGVAKVADLRPLPGFPDLTASYESEVLHPLFELRVVGSDRPGFDSYVAGMGLDRSTATPWEQIVRSGGRRMGDTLQFMEVPTVRNGRARARFFVNGIRHVADRNLAVGGASCRTTSDQLERTLGRLHVGDLVEVLAESGNSSDQNACLAFSDGTPLGWIPQVLTGAVRELLEHGGLSARVVRVAPRGAPFHTRLVVEIDAEAHESFQFDPDGLWNPLLAQ